jgi:hypothetical protein
MAVKGAGAWQCDSCEYFEPVDSTCRIRSPSVQLAPTSAPIFHQTDFQTAWPTVAPTDWCGEWVQAT